MNTRSQFHNMLTFAALSVASLTLTATSANAAITTVPTGLNPGDQYRLVFVTSGEIFGRESAGGPANISGYNAFAASAATSVAELNALGSTWSAVVSTRTLTPTTFIAAKTNTNTDPGVDGAGVPIYNLSGEVVANNNTDLWDGTIANAIDVTELGGAPTDQGGGNFLVWTGTKYTGVGVNDNSLISPTGGWITYGNTALTDTSPLTTGVTKSWIGSLGGESGWDANGNTASQMPIYVMSGILTAPDAATPEPSTLILATLGLPFLLTRRRRRR